jgi:hypothetical protein
MKEEDLIRVFDEYNYLKKFEFTESTLVCFSGFPLLQVNVTIICVI